MATLLDDRTVIYSGAFLQGAVAVVFVGYISIFTSRFHYDLTLLQYGTLFVPQIVAAVIATLFAASLGCRCRAETAYRAGLSCSLVAMALLIATERAERLPFSYPLLLAATTFVGAGLGLSFPFVRCYAVGLHPLHARRQILLVNALLAAGMAATPSYALLTRATGAWWSLPLVLGVLLITQMLLSRLLRAPPDGAPARRAGRHVPARFRVYPWLALVYGACAIVCISESQHLTGSTSHPHLAFLVLAEVGFWAAIVAACRVVFALIDGMKSRQHVASIGVFMIAIILLVLSATVTRYDMMHAGMYLLAAIGCAALIPIDTRPGDESIAVFPLAVTVGLLALFPLGLGLARFGFDFVRNVGVDPLVIFLGIAGLGAVACILLLPIILSWRTMAYFDLPAGRKSRVPAIGNSGNSGMPGAVAQSAPPRPRDPQEDRRRDWEPHGATALPQRRHGRSRTRGR